MSKIIDSTNLGYLISKIKAAFWPKADVVNITLADVATTGSYTDLTDKPSLPAAATATPLVDDTAAVGSSAKYAREDHVHPKDTSKEDTSNKVTSLSSSSTNTQYPSAKCVYDIIGDVETLINAL